MKKRIISLAVCLALLPVLVLTACSGSSQTTTAVPAEETAISRETEAPSEAAPSEDAEPSEETEAEESVIQLDLALDLANYADKWTYVTEQPKSQRGELVYDESGDLVFEPVQPCYMITDVPYCLNPADDTIQLLDIYVPEEYMDAKDNGDGTFTCTVNREGSFTNPAGVTYTGATAPIIVQNTIDGYAEGARLTLTSGRKGGGVGTYNSYLESGYVLVSIGSRGIGSAVDGTAPACVTDLKAGIRMIKTNAELMAGDVEKIIATGTSAGGGVTSVLGAASAWTMTNILENKGGFEVDYGLVWGVGHMSADYSYEDVQTYIDSICAK